MHTITELGASVPAFLGKLWKLVEDPETDDLICWAPSGTSFFIRNQAQFARELLPHYYKHNNMASFVRQLNMYGFHKKVSVELGGLKCDKDEMEFAHQYFCKGHPCLLEHIKRKIASSKSQDTAQPIIKPELMNKMLTEVRSMRGRQEHLDSRLGTMKRENEALWRELAMLRQKHIKQQQIVNKLIHFLVTLVQPSRNGGAGGLSVKRRYPLMIDDPNRQRAKQSKMSNVKVNTSPTGPVIHELDPTEQELEPEYIVAEILEHGASPSVQSPDPRGASSPNEDNIQFTTSPSPIHRTEDVHLNSDQQDVGCKKNRGSKGKKPNDCVLNAARRKNKVPVKILIPPLEQGENTREETLYLEVPATTSSSPPPEKTLPVEIKRNMKPVPLAVVRSSKLAAMAANMKSSTDFDLDLDIDSVGSAEDDRIVDNVSPTEKLQKLDEILLIPDTIENDNEDVSDDEAYKDLPSQERSTGNEADNWIKNREVITNNNGEGSSAASSDLSLSCLNDPIRDEVDNHVETVQSELDNLRELLRGEGYSIDANALLGLFGADDPMSFGIPMNPELDPHAQMHREREGDDMELNGGGELMTYNPPQNFLDFDNDIFLGATSSLSSPLNNSTNNYQDSYDFEDSKASLLESLNAVNDNLESS
ncbi:heat shock factor protein isoform X2 [Neodiprion lecontei]|uniref:Heat shock factor protein isoform X2 n=1 Tax=Neodiprion lecontei TaxID=441921 RepID=A0ABM3FHT6_NEOLC|nr:heat shock factor protein isoform X2 [Neodiprion lecontei]